MTTKVIMITTVVFVDSNNNAKKTSASLMIDISFQDTAVRQNCANVKHCNKFYPFTRGQLRFYDKELHDSMQSIWKTISSWDDPVVG
mmetsp:Transcript_24812/g.58881  ORF Transcript_24812/g.58881 Transcript_24812/m.58881 type:complete len:87 (-) Transcript_24812:143-403(-)